MKNFKRTVPALILLLTLILSTFALTSCDEGEAVADINGQKPAEALDSALMELENTTIYKMEVDMNFDIKVVGLSVYGFEIDNFYLYEYDGDNEHFSLASDARSKLAEYDMEKIVSKSDDEAWFVDGVFYARKGDEKRSYEATKSPMKRSSYETALTEVVQENADIAQSYKIDGGYYFKVEITDTNKMKLKMGAEKETYKVYLHDDGKIDKIVVECKVKTLGVINLDVDYTYGGVSISAPADASTYAN